MRLHTTSYTEQITKLPKMGRHIVAQFDREGVIVYQEDRVDLDRKIIKTLY